jgi:DNA primase
MDAVEDVKARLAIEDVVGEYVQLKRAGRNFRGLSPFTAEKTPSFMVSPEKQIWHDFSSGKGGNIFSFVMEVEGIDFKTVLELLARKAGIDLTQYNSSIPGRNAKLKERMYEALELATKFYQVQFSKNKTALEYIFNKRKFTKQVVLDFRLGYAPNTGTALRAYLNKKGFNDNELQQAGLVTKNYRQPADMFRSRLMIPLSDGQGRVIGFSSRILDENPNAPKYLNTPQTLLYDKSRNVYGLHLAKEAIRKGGYVVIAEGNLDVIASHQVDVKQVVATAGTAVTEEHLKILRNLTSDIRFAFDKDQAGQNATERAIPIASKVGVNLSVIDVGEAKDPDELIRKNPEEWQKAIDSPIYALDWLIESYKSQIDISSAIGKRKFSDIILPVVGKLTDAVEQDHYLSKLSDLLQISKEALLSKVDKVSSNSNVRLKKQKNVPRALNKTEVEQIKNQDQLLAVALIDSKMRKYIGPITEEMLLGDNPKIILGFLKNNMDFHGDPLMEEALNNSLDYVKMLMLQYEALYQNLDETELDYESKRLQDRLITKYVKQQKDLLSIAMQKADASETQKLLNQAKNLDILLNQNKEVSHG